MKRCGILLPAFSLPGKYGIGSMGEEAYRFIDFLSDTGQNYWQILPLNPTSYGDSPYQSPSAFAGNPYFIDLDILLSDGLLTLEECEGERAETIDYGKLYRMRYAVLRKAYKRFCGRIPSSFYKFSVTNERWLKPYCLFMEQKEKNGGVAWTEWKDRSYSEQEYEEVNFYAFLQFTFFMQWKALKSYANAHDVKIIGDMPIYVAPDSADVWSLPQNFQLTETLLPARVAGVPPDAFSETGQLWGNPLYDGRKCRRMVSLGGWNGFAIPLNCMMPCESTTSAVLRRITVSLTEIRLLSMVSGLRRRAKNFSKLSMNPFPMQRSSQRI